MTDPLAAEATPEATPAAPPPVLTEAQIEEMIQRKTDQRVAGLQSMYDRKIKDLTDQWKKAERALAGTDDDPRESDLQAEVRRLERRNQFLEATREHPEIAPYLDRFADDITPQDIIAAFTEFRASLTPPPPPPTPSDTTAPEPVVPGVEPNNPPRERSGFELLGPNPSGDDAEKFFENYKGPWPGFSR